MATSTAADVARGFVSANKDQKCPVCSERFENYSLKLTHQKEKGHLMCKICGAAFHYEEALMWHQRKAHITEQHITCPWCHKVFNRAWTFMQHVENHQCASLSFKAVEERAQKEQEKNKKFAAGLKERSDLPISFDVPPEERVDWPCTSQVVADTAPGHCDRVPHRKGREGGQENRYSEDFPPTQLQHYRVGDSKQADLLTGDEPFPGRLGQSNSWARKENIFPGSRLYTAVPPPQELLQDVQQSFFKQSQKQPPLQLSCPFERITHPDHPQFNAAVFYEPLLELFKCPHATCKKKKHKTASALVAHLRSKAHAGESRSQRHRCGACGQEFETRTGLVSHIETASVKCNVRDTPGFRAYLAEASAGLLDAKRVGLSTDYSPKWIQSWDEYETAATHYSVNPAAVSDLSRVRGSLGAEANNSVSNDGSNHETEMWSDYEMDEEQKQQEEWRAHDQEQQEEWNRCGNDSLQENEVTKHSKESENPWDQHDLDW